MNHLQIVRIIISTEETIDKTGIKSDLTRQKIFQVINILLIGLDHGVKVLPAELPGEDGPPDQGGVDTDRVDHEVLTHTLLALLRNHWSWSRGGRVGLDAAGVNNELHQRFRFYRGWG